MFKAALIGGGVDLEKVMFKAALIGGGGRSRECHI